MFYIDCTNQPKGEVVRGVAFMTKAEAEVIVDILNNDNYGCVDTYYVISEAEKLRGVTC